MNARSIRMAPIVVSVVLAVGGAALAGKPSSSPPPPPADAAIAYTLDGTLMVMNADGTNQRSLGIPAWSPDWSPDGSEIVFASDVQGYGVYVIRKDGSGLRKVVATVATPATTYPAWSPGAVPGPGGDQARIAYSDRASSALHNDIFVVSPDGSDRVQLTDTPSNSEFNKSWSPSGTRLAVKAGSDTDDDLWGLFDFSAGTYSLQHHAGALQGGNVTFPGWSKTQEDKIAWGAIGQGGNFDLWIVDLDDPSNPVRLTATNVNERRPSWSPDDGLLVFVSNEQTGSQRSTIETMRPDGTGRKTIASDRRGFLFWTAWRRNP